MGARLTSFVRSQLKIPIDSIFYWSDSKIILAWVKGAPGSWKQFVRNRVEEIHQLSEPMQWRYCPTKHNPGDLLSRGCTIKKLKEEAICWHGPSWLMKEEVMWPKQVIKRNAPKEMSLVKLLHVRLDDVARVVSLAERYGRFGRLIRVTAMCLRFVSNSRVLLQCRHFGPLTAMELRNAQMTWYRLIQAETFSSEIARLSSGQELPKTSAIFQLDPFIAEGHLVRMGGRIERSGLSYDARHPIILPHRHMVVDLLVRSEHEKQMHAGTEHTLATLRQNVWILKARTDLCRKWHRYQKKGLLKHFLFERTGVDFAGPLYVKYGKYSKKAYACLFTCMTMRAVHLELVMNMSTDQFLLALRRFVTHRERPSLMQSDNSTTFKAADKEIQRLFSGRNLDQIKEKLSPEGITWKFITERAPWTGGYWERLVRSVKMALRKVLGHALLTELEMGTVLAEHEAKDNARPLTFVGEDPKDVNVLTPFHFLIGREHQEFPEQKPTQGLPTLKQPLNYEADGSTSKDWLPISGNGGAQNTLPYCL
ncbi:hypothetical protein M513_11047 [Trichuris suis]|uniref:Integrase catalytic domain-containing protein n=1 Tax=Trichuris suis TaxID=68888 RepID=A0A085LT08_9BILA|nr:hypothetical protein M513_11047 [Trichuris suis]